MTAEDELFGDALVRAYVDDDPRFVERPWLVDEVDRELSEDGCRFVLVTGASGLGQDRGSRLAPFRRGATPSRCATSSVATVAARSAAARRGCSSSASVTSPRCAVRTCSTPSASRSS